MPAPRAAGRATILDVARRARVSAATVSRVLNASARVSEDVARAVLDAAANLEFRPNLLGRSLRASRSNSIGVVLPTLAHPVFADCLQGLEQAARAADHAVLLATTGYDPAQEDGAIERLLRQRVDGLVLTVADAARSRVLDKLDNERVPYVLVYNELGRRSRKARPTVSVDNRAAARQMVEHLLSLGAPPHRHGRGQLSPVGPRAAAPSRLCRRAAGCGPRGAAAARTAVHGGGRARRCCRTRSAAAIARRRSSARTTSSRCW